MARGGAIFLVNIPVWAYVIGLNERKLPFFTELKLPWSAAEISPINCRENTGFSWLRQISKTICEKWLKFEQLCSESFSEAKIRLRPVRWYYLKILWADFLILWIVMAFFWPKIPKILIFHQKKPKNPKNQNIKNQPVKSIDNFILQFWGDS